MIITIDELKRLCDLILTVPEKEGIKEAFVSVNDYRSFFSDDSFNLDNLDERVCISSFFENWDRLMRVVDDQNSMASVDCERLGSIISIVGDAILKSNKTGIRKVALNDLKKMCKKIMSIIEESGFREITINMDRYKYIESAEAYNMDVEELHPKIRSLIDQLKSLKKILAGQVVATIADFESLGNVIRMIGYIISITPDKELLDLRAEKIKNKSVKVKELKKLCDLILAAPEQQGIKAVCINVDYYWVILTDRSFDLDVIGKGKCIGSFADDWDSLQEVVNDKDPMTSLDCDRLGNIINTVGDALLKSEKTGYRKVVINDLKKMCKKLISIIERSGFIEFMINVDRYRYIEHAEAYDMDIEKQHPKTRSFIDEWKDLRKILAGQKVAAIADFESLGNVIRIVGYAISKTTDRILLDLRDEEK